MSHLNDLDNAEIAELKAKVEALGRLLREAITMIRVMRLGSDLGPVARELLDEFVASLEERGKRENGNV